MIWSLIKVLLFVAAITGLTYGAGVLMDTGGGIQIAMLGVEFTLGPLQTAVALLLLLVGVWVLLKLIGFVVAVLRFLSGDETAISRYFDRNRERKGYQALSDGLMALASGEGRVALSRAAKADKLLDKPGLTTLLIAQAAEMTGDTNRAEAAYKKLLSNDKSRFVGVRGLMRQKITQGDTATALKLAEKAFALKPKHAEIQDTLLGLQTGQGDWKGARVTLGAKQKSGALPRDVYRRRDAVLALQEASGVIEEGATIEAREAAIEANRLSPDLIPAATMAARSYIAKGDTRHATKVLKKAWSVQPHPDLAAAFAEIAPNESTTDRLKRFRVLTKLNPDHIETRLLLAELNITAEDFPAARRALGDLASTNPNARTLAIMAAVERGEGADDAVIRGWLARALTAPRGPQWCCDKCQAIHAHWGPVCDNCSSFDTLSWREPVDTSGPSATGSELLPLIIGAPEEPAVVVEGSPEEAEIITEEAEAKTEK
ncbi:heme biosynthesis protein HemY [Pseudorhodobacter turbinis]|uniref:Heme biosynthesis protein HemY n=1 Tax=Pseudorhodobacter turbinis TaxID=2500533 RepID=A0A4P8EGD6_9RHOB|nr:heme biosynthesis HemY N-terminal domain-containing protein [Pseudorhodobacter turbinis]QCO55849.1 heme biosynthesis protein HemY [Pseudorhodobacter turbinis]